MYFGHFLVSFSKKNLATLCQTCEKPASENDFGRVFGLRTNEAISSFPRFSADAAGDNLERHRR
jgi:hypothetical protein